MFLMSHSVSDQFLKGISTQTIVTISKGVLQILVFAIFSRLLSKSDFGYYAAITGITMIFSSISSAGIGSAIIQQKQLSNIFCSTAYTLNLLVGVGMGLLFLFLSPILATIVLDSTLEVPMRLMTIPLVLNSISGYAGSILSRELKFGIKGKMSLFSFFVSSVIAIFCAINGGGVYALITLYVLDSIIYTILLHSIVHLPSLAIGKKEAKTVISFGGWLTLGVIMSTISNQLDKLVLGKWLSVERLGAYNRPSGFISNVIGQINTVFDSVLFPILSGFQDSKEQFRRILYSSFGLLTTMGTMLAMMLFFNSKLIIHIFFGNEWLDLVPILQISSLSAIFMLNNTLADCFYRSFNLVKSGFFIRTGGIILTLIFIYFGAQHDILGVAIAILCSNLIVVIFKYLYLCNKSKSKISKFLMIAIKSWIPSIPILTVALLLLLLPQHIVSEIVNALVLCTICVLLLVKYPKFVGEDYLTILYPKVEVVLQRIIKNRVFKYLHVK